MSYIDNHLMPGEKVLFRCRPHWIIFSTAALWFVVAILLFTIGPQHSIGQMRLFSDTPLFRLAGNLVSLLALLLGFMTYITYISSEFGITNKRVLIKTGFISRNSLEILLNKIESIKVNQSIPGRVLGYGSLIISGTGGSKDPFFNIPKPLNFRRIVQEQIASIGSTND